MNEGIFAKIDWYQVVLYNTTVKEVLTKLCIFDFDNEEFLKNVFPLSRGYQYEYCLQYSGVSMFLREDDYLTTDEESLLTTVFKVIRLEISGSGLDYLRAYMLPDTVFFDPTFWGRDEQDYHITRVDFAFDFINTHSTFLDEFCDWTYSNGVHTKQRLSVGRKGGVEFRQNVGSDVRCLYLGGSRSERLIRIYDKKQEQMTRQGTWRGNSVYQGLDPRFRDIPQIDSWFRIEVQTRRSGKGRMPSRCLFGSHGDMLNVLGMLRSDYAVRDASGAVLPFLQELYDWTTTVPIKYISDFIQYDLKVIDRVCDLIDRNIKALYVYLIANGVPALIERVNRKIHGVNNSSDPADVRRRVSTMALLSQMLEEEHHTISYYQRHYTDDPGGVLPLIRA